MEVPVVPRKHRRVKGLNLVDIVRLLHAQRSQWADARVSESARHLLEERVVVSGWYPYEPFDELLTLSHQRLFGGTDEAALQMGVRGGKRAFGGVHKAYVREGDPARTLTTFGRAWGSYFDFAEIRSTVDDSRAEIVCAGYPDMSRTHAYVIVGWALALLELSGVGDPHHGVLAMPCEGADELRFELRW